MQDQSFDLLTIAEAADELRIPSMTPAKKRALIRTKIRRGELMLSSDKPMLIRRDALMMAFAPRANHEVRLQGVINQKKQQEAIDYVASFKKGK